MDKSKPAKPILDKTGLDALKRFVDDGLTKFQIFGQLKDAVDNAKLLDQHATELTRQIDAMKVEIEKLKTTKDKLADDTAQAQKQFDEISGSLATAKTELQKHAAAHYEAGEKRALLDKQTEEAAQRLAEVQKALREAQAKFNEEAKRHQEEIDRTRKAIEEWKDKLNQARQSYEKWRQEVLR